jgi:hypothetical protein
MDEFIVDLLNGLPFSTALTSFASVCEYTLAFGSNSRGEDPHELSKLAPIRG